MSGIWDRFVSAACSTGVAHWPACAPTWQTYISPEALTNIFAAVFGALIGAIVGGIASFLVQKLSLQEQREDRASEEEKLLKDRLKLTIMTTMRIMADMQNVRQQLNNYRNMNPPDFKLWQAAHTLQFTPAFRPELTQLEALMRLNSQELINVSMWLYSEYGSMFSLVERYNHLREDYIERRWSLPSDRVDAMISNLQNLASFIDSNSQHIIVQTSYLQQLIGEKSKLYFGDLDFLKLEK